MSATETEEYEQSYYSLIDVLARMLELHDPIAGAHSKRVAAAAEFIAIQMNMTAAEILDIKTSALLHDMGKVSIPEHILRKEPNSLNIEEKALLNEHPVIGEDALKPVSKLDSVRKIIRHHHETLNGKGWPDKITGTQIPLGSRIIAVADIYDKILFMPSATNMTARKDIASTHLRNNAGVLYDAEVVKLFLEYIEVKDMVESETRELAVLPTKLKEGMILSQDLRTSKGLLVLTKETKVGTRELERISHLNRISPMVNPASVYAD